MAADDQLVRGPPATPAVISPPDCLPCPPLFRVSSPPPRSGFVEPCLPSPADSPPTGPDWVHEIKHEGYRLMARRELWRRVWGSPLGSLFVGC